MAPPTLYKMLQPSVSNVVRYD